MNFEDKPLVGIYKIADKFFHSPLYIALVTIAGILGFVLQQEIYALYFIAVLMGLNWMFCEDLTAHFLGMFIIFMTSLARYDGKEYFKPMWYAAIILIPAMIFRLFKFKPKIRLGRFFVPTLAVAISITFGGMLYLNTKEYFSSPGIIYVIALGIVALLVNVILESTTPKYRKDNIKFFAQMMLGVGIMGIAMVISNYIKHQDLLTQDKVVYLHRHFQWGNNLSNCLLISMPFAFYLSIRSRFGLIYYVLGILQYLALVLSLSRGGIIFGTLMFPIIVITTIILFKRKWWQPSLVLMLFLIGTVLIVYFYLQPLFFNIIGEVEATGDEARANLYRLAWANFKKYPIFGTGLQYDGKLYYYPKPLCIYWYHSTIFQILGSLGIVGIVAYLIQFIYRFIALIEVKSKFNVYTALAVLGFAGYSMVNVGYFALFPGVYGLIHLFVMVDRNNKMIKNDPSVAEKESLDINIKFAL